MLQKELEATGKRGGLKVGRAECGLLSRLLSKLPASDWRAWYPAGATLPGSAQHGLPIGCVCHLLAHPLLRLVVQPDSIHVERAEVSGGTTFMHAPATAFPSPAAVL